MRANTSVPAFDVGSWRSRDPLLRCAKRIALFDFFDERAEAGSLGREEQNEAQAKGTA